MNRHPAVLARMAMTVADLAPGRVELGIGIGGHPAEHLAYGIDFPDAARARGATGGGHHGHPGAVLGRAVGLRGHVLPADRRVRCADPEPAPRILVAAETPMGVKLAARMGDGWITFDTFFDRLLPVYLEALEAAGRRR